MSLIFHRCSSLASLQLTNETDNQTLVPYIADIQKRYASNIPGKKKLLLCTEVIMNKSMAAGFHIS